MRTLFTLAFITIVNPAVASIGASLDFAKKQYGAIVEVSTYRPDLYPTSYVFRVGDAKIEVTPLPEVISHFTVFFSKEPPDTPEKLLERYSGRTGWEKRALTDPDFAREFPLFSTTAPKNLFFVTEGAFALCSATWATTNW